MPISRAKKEQLVEKYVERLNGSDAIIITDYRGLNVNEIQQLRANIREAEGSFTVVKNTLVRRAFSEVGLSVTDEMLTGPMGIGFCNHNLTGVAKAVVDFAKENEVLTIKGGLMGDKFIDEAAIKDLASLPSLEVLRAQILGLINTPATQLAGVMASSVRQVVNVVQAYSDKDSESTAEE